MKLRIIETDDRWTAKQNYIDRRNRENAEIDSLTEEQHEVLAWLAGIRHDIHTNAGSMWNTDSGEYSYYWKLVYNPYGEDCKINETLREAELPLITFGDYSDTPNSEDYFEDVYGDKEDYIDLVDWMENTNYYNEFMQTHENINQVIENYLRDIDKHYGTKYAPTGYARLYN